MPGSRIFRAVSSSALLPLQAMSGLIAMALLTLAPRANEPVVLMPVMGSTRPALAALLADSETRLLGRGSISGSLVVIAPRLEASALFRDTGVIALAGRPGLCGTAVVRRV